MNSLYLSISQKCVLPTVIKAGHYCQIVGKWGGVGLGGSGEVGRGSLVKRGSRADLWPFYG